MTDQQIIKNMRASFLMEGLEPTKEDDERGMKILQGEADVDDIIAEPIHLTTKVTSLLGAIIKLKGRWMTLWVEKS